MKNSLFLDVGCGSNKQHGYIGMDKRGVPGVDIVHDVEVFPWPIEDGSCSTILMSHLVEHIKPWLQLDLLDECWRVLEDDGLVFISTPYATSFGYSQDPTHCSPWNEATPFYYDPDQPLYHIYQPKPWKIEKRLWQMNLNLELVMRKRAEG